MTKRRSDRDEADDAAFGSFKLKRPNDERVSILLSSIADKTTTSVTTPTSVTSSVGMDEKALKAVDLNRQPTTQNVGDVHERICRENPVPEALVDKIVAFHFGQLTLTIDNLTQFYLFLEARFRKFAHALNVFQSLGTEDRDILLTNNAPYYFQVIIFFQKGASLLSPHVELNFLD